MRAMPLEIGTLHFIGIGGIGMSGIAEVLADMGYTVQGSDLNDGPNVTRLSKKGIHVHIGHDKSNLILDDDTPVDVVVISSAIKQDNAELKEARRLKLPIVRRANMLAELMRLKWSVAVGGTHGKTTTTSLVGAMLEEAGYDPTIINGGIVNRYGSNTRLGKSDWMVVEADESDGSFTKLPATVSVVTNIDPEHMEFYGSEENLHEAFYRFVDNTPFYGFAILCTDHPEVQNLVSRITDKRVITYGFNPQADMRAVNIRPAQWGHIFDVEIAAWLNDGEELTLKDVPLPMPGAHNVQNALVALTLAQEMGISPALMKKALENFSGVKRRFTKTGESHGVTVIDDYGHHPVEIAAVLKAGRSVLEGQKGKLIAVMQPHRYSRLENLFEDFCRCFNDADTVFVSPVYAAGEAPIDGISNETLAQGIARHGHKSVIAFDDKERLPAHIAEHAEDGDLVIFLGAGDITKWAYELPTQLDEIFSKSEKKLA